MNLIQTAATYSVEDFWKAVNIYCEHPNSINKQVLFSKPALHAQLEKNLTKNDCLKLYNYFCEILTDNCDVLEAAQNIEYLTCIDGFDEKSSCKMNLLIRKLTPKCPNSPGEFYEFLFLDKTQVKLYIFTKHIDTIKLNKMASEDSKIKDPLIILKFNNVGLVYSHDSLKLYYDIDLGKKGVNWLNDIFVPKFLKLMSNSKQKMPSQSCRKLNFTSKVDVVEYYQTYEKLKAKYAKNLIENWTETTDPKKFVYEDIGIATYLLLLWKGSTDDNKTKKIKFVDLGCGNGLLVYILNSEGHLGVGFDIKKRKIWDTYSSSTILKEKTIIPTEYTSYPSAEWIVGNHSDELTAWIPIIARRSNNYCNYFVLPCCPYQLNGTKFQRKNSALSSYQDFLNYVKEISELCEFETYIDKLRIPSTKRICLIGLSKPDATENTTEFIKQRILDLINKECKLLTNNVEEKNDSNEFSWHFKIRESTESVRNCTKLPPLLTDKILKEVKNVLLRQSYPCMVIRENETYSWNRGSKLSLGDLANSIDEKLLKELKKECKGLQTFLKNHHFIFEINEGFVQFRCPKSMLKISNKFQKSEDSSKWKKKNCWFYENHPDKCPLSDKDCSYNHSL